MTGRATTGSHRPTPSDPEAFEAHVRAVLARIATPMAAMTERPAYVPRETGVAFQRELYDAGLAGLTVPREYGGVGLERRHQEIFNAVASEHWMPSVMFAVTIGMCVPTLLQFGTEDQKRRHVPRMLRGDEIWCQMFSEPGAGSDLASLRMRAEDCGDGWILDGQKVWTSAAHYADFGMCAVRTDPASRRQHGISMLIVPMDAPGVEVRPLVLATGESAFNEVFCNGVHIPREQLVGELHHGWACVKAMLMSERVALGAGGSPLVTGKAQLLADRARAIGRSADPVVRDRLADVWIRERVLALLGARVRARAEEGRASGPEGSLAKLLGSELLVRVADLTGHLDGARAQAWADDDRQGADRARSIVHAPSLSIGGGTSEIQRNIIAERLLALPRDLPPPG